LALTSIQRWMSIRGLIKNGQLQKCCLWKIYVPLGQHWACIQTKREAEVVLPPCTSFRVLEPISDTNFAPILDARNQQGAAKWKRLVTRELIVEWLSMYLVATTYQPTENTMKYFQSSRTMKEFETLIVPLLSCKSDDVAVEASFDDTLRGGGGSLHGAGVGSLRGNTVGSKEPPFRLISGLF